MNGVRAAARWLGVALVFVVLVPLHGVARIFGQREAFPSLFLNLVGRVAGLEVRTQGVPHQGALLLANHVSWLDIVALGGSARASFVAHSGLASHPALKWLCDQNATVFITRDQRGSVGRQVRQVRDAIGRRPLVIFPEATTNDGTRLLPFRSSLLSAAEPLAGEISIQPVALAYQDAAEIAWFGEEPGMANVRRILARREPVRLAIHFLEPLHGAALADRKTMAQAAEAAIAHALAL